MAWEIRFTARARKLRDKLPENISLRLEALAKAIMVLGPKQLTMPHFGRLKNWPGEVYHCHLNKGRPTYVAVWRVEAKTVIVEIIYVGTHENAPY